MGWNNVKVAPAPIGSTVRDRPCYCLFRTVLIFVLFLGFECRSFCQSTNIPLLTASQLFEATKDDGKRMTFVTNHLVTLFGSPRETTYFAIGMKTFVHNGVMSGGKWIVAMDYRGTNYLVLEEGGQFYWSMFLASTNGVLEKGLYHAGGEPVREVTTNQWAVDEFTTEEKFWCYWIHTNSTRKLRGRKW